MKKKSKAKKEQKAQNDTPIKEWAANPYDILSKQDQAIVEMRVNRVPTHIIAEAAKKTQSTIRHWFMKGGRLKAAYSYIMEERAKEYAELFKTIEESIHEGAVEAVAGLRQDLKKRNMQGFLARKDILDRAGFKAKDKSEIDLKVPTSVRITVVKRYDKPKK